MNKIRYEYFKILKTFGADFGRWGRLKIPLYSKTWKYLFKEIFIDEVYSFTCNTAQPFIIDCGANIGYAILYFKNLFPQSEVLAFEASAKTYDKLLETLKNNESITGVTVEKKALTNQQDTILKFYKNATEDLDLGASLSYKKEAIYEEVETRKLSSYLNKTVDFLKLDIEGAETDVFKDLVQSQKLQLIQQGLIEFHLDESNRTNSLSYILEALTSHGFIYRLIEIDEAKNQWPEQQAILVRFKKA